MRYVARRAAQSVVIIAGVIVLTFLLLHIIPGDPARQILGIHATDEQVAQLRQRWLNATPEQRSQMLQRQRAQRVAPRPRSAPMPHPHSRR